MAEELAVSGSTREELYASLLPQIKALIGDEQDPVANMANCSAAIREVFGFFWVGFYIVRDGELVLGPFQGPIACTRIRKGKGVCGTAWSEARSMLVPDVDAFPGHIACSSQSKSEVVIPLIHEGEVRGVLDIDSDQADDFSEIDLQYLEELCQWLSTILF
ncbi:MAG: GAF domain-containing protein [Bacteroidetes bacterium]|nr:MAG: GAF domain-containing protein [Bacteroidota bacterium]